MNTIARAACALMLLTLAACNVADKGDGKTQGVNVNISIGTKTDGNVDVQAKVEAGGETAVAGGVKAGPDGVNVQGQVDAPGQTKVSGNVTASGNGNVVIGGNVRVPGAPPTVKGSGVKATKQIPIKDFTRLTVNLSADVIIQTGKVPALCLEADDNLLELIAAEVVQDRLEIAARNSFSTQSNIKVTVTAPKIEAATCGGTGTLVAKDLNTDVFALMVSGSGNATATGKCKRLELSMSGSGEAHCFGLLAEDASVDITGSGDVEVSAEKTLKVSVTGTGDVVYRGSPIVTKRITGVGDVRKEGAAKEEGDE